MKKLVKILKFTALFLCLVGVLGGIGCAVMTNSYVIALGLVLLIYYGWVGVENLYKDLSA